MKYELEKRFWTEKDFDRMGWHDCQIYKIGLTEDLAFDIDYILQWNQPEIEGLPFTFWISPATLIFKNIRNLSFDIEASFEDSLEIESIERIETEECVQWIIITRQGDFEFLSDGYEQYIRQEPFFQFGQTISYIERCGRSLEKTLNQNNPNRHKEDVIEQRTKDLEHYENVKKRQILRLEKEKIENEKLNNKIDTKQYLLRKKEIKDLIFYYDYWLKGTIFENW